MSKRGVNPGVLLGVDKIHSGAPQRLSRDSEDLSNIYIVVL